MPPSPRRSPSACPRRRSRSNGTEPPKPPQYTSVFGEALIDECERDERVCGITAAMNSGTGLNLLQKAMPDRYYDVGIAEQHAVLLAAGMALQGMKPVAAIYSTFLQRGVRPDRPRRRAPEPGRRVRDGPRRPRRRRRADPPRRLRHLLHAPAAEHDADGAARRGRARRHAAHGDRPRRPGRPALPARRGRGRAAALQAQADRDRQGRGPARGRPRRAARLRLRRAARARRRRPARAARASRSPSPTRASPSRSTPS